MGLPALQDRRERGDLITMYKIVNGIEKIDKEDLVLGTEEDRRTRGHVKKLRTRQCVCEGYWKIQFSPQNGGEVERIE